jgi:flagellar P-ring protein precursor FlgI
MVEIGKKFLNTRWQRWTFVAGVLLIVAAPASAVRVGTLARISGSESKGTLVGLGLVTGLSNTGDGNESAATRRKLVAMFNRLGEPLLTTKEISNPRNVAVVIVEVQIPDGGSRQGDRVDVHVTAPFASSLKGGRLVLTPLVDPITRQRVMAYAKGNLRVEDAEEAPNNAVIRSGASLTQDFKPTYINANGQMMLILKQPYARWPVANLIATNINDRLSPPRAADVSIPGAKSRDGRGKPVARAEPVAKAVDQKNILINVPVHERKNPGAFISQILEITVPPELVLTGATIVINRKAKTVVISGDVELSPVAMSAGGVQVQLQGGGPVITGTQLMQGLQAATIPVDAQISLIIELHKAGKLHGDLVLE